LTVLSVALMAPALIELRLQLRPAPLSVLVPQKLNVVLMEPAVPLARSIKAALALHR